ncbi:MAG TPA: hypothetical protein VNR65_02925 [Geobacterales bacterium]|jgi:hypothetical protein|nr:hypothetical protein [Geobacterales bacterium]
MPYMLDGQKQRHRHPNHKEQVAIFGHTHFPYSQRHSGANKLGRKNRLLIDVLMQSSIQKLRLMYAT